MSDKIKWTFLIIFLLALLGGGAYYFLNKKYYPKVKDITYLKLELANDTAQVKVGIKIQNRIPLSIALDSIYYTIEEDSTELGWGQMTTAHKLPPLASKEVDFHLLLDFDKYRNHLQEQQGKDSIKLDVKLKVFFDLPLIRQQHITLNRHLAVPVAKPPSLKLEDLVVRSFSVDSGYSFLLKIDATNKDLPNLRIDNLSYSIKIGDTLKITGDVDSTFQIQKGNKIIQVPLQLKTSDAIALINRKLSGDATWEYDAQLETRIKSDHKLFGEFKLTVEKEGTLDIRKMGSNKNYQPSIKQVKRLEVDSNEEQTILQATLVVHNPAPIPFYVDSATYYIRHEGKLVASGKKKFDKVLPKQGDQLLNLRLLIDESTYQKFMKNVQYQEKAKLDLELNLLYNLPNANRQKITLQRQMQVPVSGQGGVKVVGLDLVELDPDKGASLSLKLLVQSTNLPNLSIHNLTYKLQLGEDLQLTGKTKNPIRVNEATDTVEVPIHLSAEDVNQLVRKALKGNINWHYDLQASAELRSSNKMMGPTKLHFEFNGELEMVKGGGSKKLIPQITKVDSLDITIHYDTAWVKLNIQVKNPLPINFFIDSLSLKLAHQEITFATSSQKIEKILPAEGTQSAWVTLAVNFGKWHQFLTDHQQLDSLKLDVPISLVYRIGDLSQQRVSFESKLQIRMPDLPAIELQKVKFRGISLTEGILVNALIKAKNANTKNIYIKDLTYNVCVENLLDTSGNIDKTYHIKEGNSVIKVPMSLGLGEVFRAVFARLSGNKKKRNLYLNGTATVTTESPKIQDTFVRFEKREKANLFQKKKKQQEPKTP